AKLIDIVPTILYYMNIPIPEYIDGRVIIEVFKDKKSIKYSKDFTIMKKRDEFEYDDTAIKDKLRGLGYLE
ncbi:MAG: hypothetical protein ACFFDN_38855, partial [Candidatus Hodarchaeota archaeon]